MDRPIWLLWEPRSGLPPYLELCLRTIERNSGCSVNLLDEADVLRLAPAIRPELARKLQSVPQRVDYYRTHLLAARGGLWLDVDVIVFEDLGFVFDALSQREVVVRESVSNRYGVSNNFLAARPRSRIIRNYIERQESLLERYGAGDPMTWMALGAKALSASIDNEDVSRVPAAKVAPVRSRDSWKFMSPNVSPARVLAGSPSTVMLYNSQFPDTLRAMSQSELMSSDMLLARLLRIALGEASLSEEPARVRRACGMVEELARDGAAVVSRGLRSLARRTPVRPLGRRS